MPEIKSVQSLYLILGFLVPGLIASYVRAQFLTGRTPSHTEAALSYVVLSMIYYALTLPLVDVVLSLREPGYQKTLGWFALVFVGPAVFGLLLGINAQKELTRRFLQWCCLNPVHVMPTAWDWKFSNMQEQWVIATLKDGTRFAGWCGRGSFASSDPKERDVYIERVFDIGDNNEWHQRDSGVLLIASEIRSIEFWPVNRGANP